MPSWKKVITSGSAAAFSSLIVSSTITGSISGSLTGSLQGTASWAQNSLTASFAPNYLLTSSFNTWTGSNSSQFSGTSSRANFTRVIRISGSLPGDVEEGGSVYILPVYRSGNAVFGSTGSVYTVPILSSTGLLHYSSSLDRILTTASWAVNALTASYAMNAPSALPGGNFGEIQYNNSNTFGGVPALIYTGSTLIGTGSFTGRFDGNLRLGLFRGTRTTIPAPISKESEVLVYTQQITAGTFTNDDIIRIHYKIDQATSDNAIYRIYIADTNDFTNISGSLTNLIANVTASSTVRYVGIKRDLSYDGSKLRFMNSGSTSTTDDITTTLPISEFTADLTGTEYYMFFSAIPNQVAHSSKALSYSIERV